MGRAATISKVLEEEAEAEADEGSAGAELVGDSIMVAGAKLSKTTFKTLARASGSLSALLLSRKNCQTPLTCRWETGCELCYTYCCTSLSHRTSTQLLSCAVSGLLSR